MGQQGSEPGTGKFRFSNLRGCPLDFAALGEPLGQGRRLGRGKMFAFHKISLWARAERSVTPLDDQGLRRFPNFET